MIRRRVLYFSGRFSRSHVWDSTLWGIASSRRCRCGRFTYDDTKVDWSPTPRGYSRDAGPPPRGWPVSERCRRSRGEGGRT